VIIKSYIIEKNDDIINKNNMFLFYGENIGLKENLKEKIIKTATDKTEIFNFFESELLKNEQLLNVQLNNQSLFVSEKIIIINEATEKIFKLVHDLSGNQLENTRICVLADVLDKKSKLRNLYEKNKEFIIVACYKDDERNLSNYIREELKEYKGLSQEIINLLINNSNLDRRIIKNEINKVKLFFTDFVIKKELLVELINLKSISEFDILRDASLLGNKDKVNRLMGELQFVNENNYYYISQMYYRLNKLLELNEIKKNTNDNKLAMEMIKPKVFWKDKPVYSEQMKKWNYDKIMYALEKTKNTEELMKINTQIRGDILIKKLLIDICTKASSPL